MERAIGDIDGDGDQDFLTIANDGSDIRILETRGGQRFLRPEQTQQIETIGNASVPVFCSSSERNRHVSDRLRGVGAYRE